MPNFSLTTGYAIEALACLARQGPEAMLVREIADCTQMPLPYLAKIIQRLGEAGIVGSKRGYKGGVKLLRKPEQISLLQINAAVEGGRPGQDSGGLAENARPNTFWEAFQQAYRAQLAAMTLADVLAYETPPPEDAAHANAAERG
jgi:Rrf2 family iron-sulfur cluster assembly transcriptional regulator